jgi:hypothetical protein
MVAARNRLVRRADKRTELSARRTNFSESGLGPAQRALRELEEDFSQTQTEDRDRIGIVNPLSSCRHAFDRKLGYAGTRHPGVEGTPPFEEKEQVDEHIDSHEDPDNPLSNRNEAHYFRRESSSWRAALPSTTPAQYERESIPGGVGGIHWLAWPAAYPAAQAARSCWLVMF